MSAFERTLKYHLVSYRIVSVGLRKCPYDHYLANKAYFSAVSRWKTFVRVSPTRWRRKPAGIEITSLSFYVMQDNVVSVSSITKKTAKYTAKKWCENGEWSSYTFLLHFAQRRTMYSEVSMFCSACVIYIVKFIAETKDRDAWRRTCYACCSYQTLHQMLGAE